MSEPNTVAVASVNRMRLRRGMEWSAADEAGALGDRDQGAQVVEQIDKEEDEDDFEQSLGESAANVELKCGVLASSRKPPVDGVQCTSPSDPGDRGNAEHADEDGAAHLFHFQGHHQNQAE